VLALASVTVLAAHGLLLWSLGPAWIDPDEAPATAPALAPSLSVRSVVARAPEPTPALKTPPPAAPAKPARVVPPVRLAAPAASAVVAATEPPVEDMARSAPTEPLAAGAAVELPLYAVRIPEAGSWRYRLQRGLASGQAQLSWQPAPDGRYLLRLEGTMAGVTVLEWVSRGTIDHAGIAPERFAIRRRGRDHQAANFQRDAGKITFSGPTYELALLPGVQDRLSWMLQLGAILEAAPQRFGPGARLTLMVVAARGGADIWHFTVLGTERIGEVSALKLVREARRPHDTQVEIWLDPARGHLPLRAVLAQAEGGPPLELQLEASTGP
jgi:hypothetical protein